jgi:hypothetical protein
VPTNGRHPPGSDVPAGDRHVLQVLSALAEHRDHCQYQEHNEQDPGNVAGSTGNAGEAEHGGDDGDDEKDDGCTPPVTAIYAADEAFSLRSPSSMLTCGT